jgi:hypothetical protein
MKQNIIGPQAKTNIEWTSLYLFSSSYLFSLSLFIIPLYFSLLTFSLYFFNLFRLIISKKVLFSRNVHLFVEVFHADVISVDYLQTIGAGQF